MVDGYSEGEGEEKGDSLAGLRFGVETRGTDA